MLKNRSTLALCTFACILSAQPLFGTWTETLQTFYSSAKKTTQGITRGTAAVVKSPLFKGAGAIVLGYITCTLLKSTRETNRETKRFTDRCRLMGDHSHDTELRQANRTIARNSVITFLTGLGTCYCAYSAATPVTQALAARRTVK